MVYRVWEIKILCLSAMWRSPSRNEMGLFHCSHGRESPLLRVSNALEIVVVPFIDVDRMKMRLFGTKMIVLCMKMIMFGVNMMIFSSVGQFSVNQ